MMDGGALFGLSGRTAMITGASSGLGARFAIVAAANGANVVLVGRRADRLQRLCETIEGSGGTAIVAVTDVTDTDAMLAAFDLAEKAFGPVDLFVANAGISAARAAMQETPITWREILGTDLDAVFFGAQEAARRMIKASTTGSIISVASIAGLIAGSEVAAYSIAKAAVIQSTKVLAKELGPSGIRVNVIAPGWVLTEMSHSTLTSDTGRQIAESTPLRRFGDTSDFDGAFLLLASDAGRFITGALLVVDGGRLLSLG